MHQEIICMFGGITGGLDGVQFPDTPLIEILVVTRDFLHGERLLWTNIN